MISLILVTTFTPFLWGDAKVSTIEVQGFQTVELCKNEAFKFQSHKSQEGTTIYSTQCITKDVK